MQSFECHDLTFKIGDKIIFNNFNFSFDGQGMILLEGENGVGKSSALKLFAGFLLPQKGTITFFKEDIEKIESGNFSFLTTTSLGLLNELTGMDHINLVAKSLEMDQVIVENKIKEFMKIEIFNEILIKPVSDFSQGMRQFLRIFLHLFFTPKLIFLDEPFLYLSPTLKKFIQDQLEAMSTHSLIFITDQEFNWKPETSTSKIVLGGK